MELTKILKSQDYDIVIVGAGPAGTSVALEAAKNGLKVAVLEKEETVAHTVRTSGVTWLDAINEFGIPSDCYHPIKNFSFCSPNNQVTINDTIARAAVLDVRKTYRWLSDMAIKNGAELFTKALVLDVEKDEKGKITGVIVSINNEKITFHAKIVVDASGFQSVVARHMDYVEQWKRFGVGAEYEVKVESVDEETWWLMVGQKYSPAGYAWIFPLGNNIVRIGVGVGKPESNADPTELLKELIDKKIGPIKSLGEIIPIEFHYGLIPNDGLSRKTVFDNLILVGDSAGQANPLVLEGIRYAIRYGRIAGSIASQAVKANDTSEKRLKQYEDFWKKAIQSKINSASKVQERWLKLSDEEWDKELDIIKELKAEEFLDFIKAEFGLSNMLKLATQHPKMIVRQLFNLVKDATKR